MPKTAGEDLVEKAQTLQRKSNELLGKVGTNNKYAHLTSLA